ncbi:GntR family transcriptional regulator [Rhodobacter sp. KR11]|uniref:GntR family transcriptional regulator n=1 Tax=Rhodobacter sp. KR11 TaxID=2974588 RepID=UPI002222F361|nr:GntR family transcriptional regulator [Rhodobacter sp. KR11]MCW1920734.1 GntR family transcriptional regulator [Rhodobacter sp. KR11]
MDLTSPKETTAAGLAESLAQAIHEHRLSPGAKLSEDEVGEIFGVSRTIVRAALQQLSHERLVDLKRNRGAFVAQPSIREAREVFEARALLEPRTARSAALRATAEDIAALHRHIAEEHAALDAGKAGRALFLSGAFHVEIARIADQDTIAAFVEQLVARSSLIIALYWRRRQALCESHAHHDLIQAIAARNGDLAEELMKSHLLDLLTSLDLGPNTAVARSLREALAG